MPNTDSTPKNALPTELPSTRRLLGSTAIAVATAAVVLGTVVLSAEYGVDPTGIGRLLGLKRMGEIKVALAKEAAADAAADSAGATDGVAGTAGSPARSDTAPQMHRQPPRPTPRRRRTRRTSRFVRVKAKR